MLKSGIRRDSCGDTIVTPVYFTPVYSRKVNFSDFAFLKDISGLGRAFLIAAPLRYNI